MRKDYHEYYRALGLNPGASAEEIKRAYRQLLQSWHPDHFKAGSLMQTTAEDITKEINEAYEQLYKKQLYKKYLPKAEPRRPAPPPSPVPPSAAKQAYEEASRPRRENPAPPPPQPPRTRRPMPRWARPATPVPPVRRPPAVPKEAAAPWVRRQRWAKVALASGMMLGAVVMIWTQHRRATTGDAELAFPSPDFPRLVAPPSAPAARTLRPLIATEGEADSLPRRPSPSKAPSPQVGAPAIARGGWRPTSLGRAADALTGIAWRSPDFDRLGADGVGLLDTFEVGDSKTKVLAVQGRPEDAGETIYRYGSSVVYFDHGRVSGWSNRLPRLRVHALPELDSAGLGTFSTGSSRAEVFSVQGAPTQLTARAYYYGSSAVYFDHDGVTGWDDDGFNLRTRLLPTLPYLDLDQTRGW